MTYISPQKDPGIFNSHQLKNGITVYFRSSEQVFGLPNVACSVVVTVGGRDDPLGKEGAAHFFEHMPFRGTKNYPTLRDLTYPIENNGGYVNAFTTDEATGYEIIVPADMLEDGMQRVADMLLHPLLNPEDIDTERQVIIEELRNKLASVHFYARKELYKQLLGDHPLVHSVIGSEAALRSIDRNNLLQFHSRYYNANNISLFFAGQFDQDTLITLCETYFGSIPNGVPTNRDVFVQAGKITEPTIILEPERYNRSVYMLGRTMPPTSLKESLMNKLFRDMLARGMNSPLYEEIRDKRGLAYGLSLSHSQYQDVSLLLFTVSTQFRYMDEVQSLFWQAADSILRNQPRYDEVKHMIQQSVLHREYNAGGLVDSAIDSYLEYARIVPVEEIMHVLAGITLEEVEAYMKDYLNRDDYLAIRVNCDKQQDATVQSAESEDA